MPVGFQVALMGVVGWPDRLPRRKEQRGDCFDLPRVVHDYVKIL